MGRMRITHLNPRENEEFMQTDAIFMGEMRNNPKARYAMYKRRLQSAFDKWVNKREFQVEYLVMRQADALKDVGKLEATWEGPYKVIAIWADLTSLKMGKGNSYRVLGTSDT